MKNLDSEKARQITKLVQQCWNTLELYGRDASQFKETNQLFLVVLAGYPIHRIRAAFFEYIQNNERMPKPASIKKILSLQKINGPEDYSAEYLESMERIKSAPKLCAIPDEPRITRLRQKAISKNKMPWDGLKLSVMPHDVFVELWTFCCNFKNESIAKTYAETYGIDYQELKDLAHDKRLPRAI